MVKCLKCYHFLYNSCVSVLGLGVLKINVKNIKKHLKYIDVQNIHKTETEQG
jgi:hypothetical protein